MNKFESYPGEMKNLINASEIGMKTSIRIKRKMADHILALEGELAEKTKQLEDLRPFQEMLRESNFQMISNVMTGLTALLIASMGTDKEVMTDFIIKTKDGSKHDLIRLWASHGKTPVERVDELVKERSELRKKIGEWVSDLERYDEEIIVEIAVEMREEASK